MNYQGTLEEDSEILSLLTRVFVEEGYTNKSRAKIIFAPDEVRKRGDIILAKSPTGKLLGMIILARSTSPACQVAKVDEAEIQLLSVYPEARGQGIASCLIMACERQAMSLGYSKMVLSTQQIMKEAHHVYEQLGYHKNSLRDWSMGIDRSFFVYEKSLTS